MAKQVIRQKKKAGRSGGGENSIPFTKKNYLLFTAGIFVILVGFLTLSRGSITLAPILLVAGYCVLIPLAIALK